MKLKRKEVKRFLWGINTALGQEDPKIKFDLQIKLISNKNRLKKIVDEMDEMDENMKKHINSLQLKYCDKKIDQDGNETPVIDKNTYVGLVLGQKPEFDRQMEEVQSSMKTYLEEYVEFEPVKLDEKDLPRTVSGLVNEQLFLLVDQSDNDNK